MSTPSRLLGIVLGAAALASAGAALAPPAHADAVIDGRLAGEIEQAPADQRVPVLVLLDAAAGSGRAPAARADRIRELERDAAVTQRPIETITAARDRHFWLVNALATTASAREVRELAGAPGVAWVGSDRPVKAGAGMDGGASGSPWDLAQIGVPSAWSAYHLDGTGVRIGSIDTGVDATHPGLAGRVAGWRDFVAGAPAPYDDNGHGTHTIGTMVGRGAAGQPLGVAPNATVIVAKALSGNGYGSGSAIIAAAQWIADPDGDPATDDAPDVVNNSWGAAEGNQPWFRPVVRAWIELGIVPVFAAGNGGPGPGTVGSPADYPESLAVGAVDDQRRIALFSARGPVTWSDPDGLGPAAGTALVKPDVVAPGVEVTSTVPGGGEAAGSGTSMAAPHVAGIVALMRQARPDLTPAQIEDIVRRSATDLGPAGPDADYGYGLVDAPAALAAAGALPDADPDPVREPSSGPPRSGRRTPVVTLAQIRAGRRIAVRAADRLRTVERRLFGPSGLHVIRAPRRVVRVSARELWTTRRIARAVIRRSAQLDPRGPASVQAVPSRYERVGLTPRGVRVTDRLARQALAASRRLARRTRGSGGG